MLTTTFAGATTHVVKSGDNLYRIALNHGVSVAQLQSANPGVSAQSLRIGQKLVIPARGQANVARNTTPAPAATPRAAATGTYEVKSGDSLSKIARLHGTTVAALQAANPTLNPTKMAIGQKINLSGSGATSSNTAIAKAPAPTPAPAPAPAPAPKELVAVEESTAPMPTPAPAPAPVVAVEESKAPAPTPVVDTPKTENVNYQPADTAPASAAYRLIKTTRELTLAEVAKENGTTTDKLNALNGWSFSPQTLLAVDSELYVPAQPK